MAKVQAKKTTTRRRERKNIDKGQAHIHDLSAQALDLQAENARLKEENAELKKGVDYESRILRHHQPYLTLDGETPTAFYCSVCWGKDKKLIQMRDVSETDYSCRNLYCIVCNNRCRLDNE